MVDFHTHILYGVDDGARTPEESIELLKESRKAGFDKVILTSHYMEDYYKTEVDERSEIKLNLDNFIQNQNIDLNLYMGNEVFITENIMNLLKTNKIATINNTNYMLFELPFNVKPINILDLVYEMQYHEIIPVLAHPERYSYFYSEPEFLYELVEKGVLFQANFGSFIGQFGKRAKIMAEKLLKCNLIHFLGSDVHKPNSTYNKIPEILDVLTDLVGSNKVNQLTEINPNLVLANKRIEVEKTYPIKWGFKEKLIMKKK